MLPKQSSPIYQTTIPSTGKKINFRPFLVRDKKSLMMANISNDTSVMISTLKGIIKSCIEEDIDVDSLATFDIEKLFCIIRAKSDGEIVNLAITCKECGNQTEISLDVSQIDVQIPPDHEKRFNLFDNVGVAMRYPTYDDVMRHSKVQSLDDVISMIVDSIEYIYDDKRMYSSKEASRSEFVDFVENLTEDQLNKLKKFFDTMPKFSHTLNFKCPHCSNEEEIIVEGINNFF